MNTNLFSIRCYNQSSIIVSSLVS